MTRIVDQLPPFDNGVSISDTWNSPVVSGYTCPRCGLWPQYGRPHVCITSGSVSFWQCPRCGQCVTGTSHVCSPPIAVGTFYPPAAATCNHCYCIDVPPSGERTKPHHKCCQCGDTRVKER